MIILQRFLPPPPVSGMWPFSLMACLRGTEEVGQLNRSLIRELGGALFEAPSVNTVVCSNGDGMFYHYQCSASLCVPFHRMFCCFWDNSCNGTFSGSRGTHGPIGCEWRRDRDGRVGEHGVVVNLKEGFLNGNFPYDATEQFLQFHQASRPPYSSLWAPVLCVCSLASGAISLASPIYI